ncbi:MAG: helicase HerA domain-containing protein [Oscillospiraceae bacterium]
MKSANGLYLGSTGSGKSFAAKRELIHVFLATQDRIIVVDPMGEYAPLVRRLGGQVIELAPDSPSFINPMDIQLDLETDESPSVHESGLPAVPVRAGGGRQGGLAAHRKDRDRPLCAAGLPGADAGDRHGGNALASGFV